MVDARPSDDRWVSDPRFEFNELRRPDFPALRKGGLDPEAVDAYIGRLERLRALRYMRTLSTQCQSVGGDKPDDCSRPLAGDVERGKEFNPSDEPENRDEDRSAPRPAPAPRTPVSDDEYERLKEAARQKRQRPGGPAQEDPGGEKAD